MADSSLRARASSPARRPRAAVSVSPPPSKQEPRGARRKRETRDKLLRAAFELFAERGADGVAINEITEGADVGFGSFYNHFESKEAIYDEVFNAVFEAFGASLDQLTQDIEDPAEVIAVCVRHTITRARLEPLWGRFFLREAFRASAMTRGLGVRLLRDIQKGIAQKRFDVADVPMAALVAGGTVVATVAAEAAMGNSRARSQLDTKKFAERAAAVLLESLGVRRAEAAKIAARALPSFEWPPLFA